MIDDPAPKVRHTVAFVYYKLSEFVPEIIISSQENLDMFITNSLNHLHEDPIIVSLLIGGFKNLFIQTANRNMSYILNGYFQ